MEKTLVELVEDLGQKLEPILSKEEQDIFTDSMDYLAIKKLLGESEDIRVKEQVLIDLKKELEEN